MAKAKRLYSGHDSYGRAIEVAERTDGVLVLARIPLEWLRHGLVEVGSLRQSADFPG